MAAIVEEKKGAQAGALDDYSHAGRCQGGLGWSLKGEMHDASF
jgi:hypothetical protein